MAIDKIVVEVTGDAKGVKPVIDGLEDLNKVSKENATQFRKTNAEFQKGVGESTKAVNKHVESLKSLVPAVSAAFAVQAVIDFGKASLNAFIEAERGEKLLLNALGKNEAAFKRLTDAAKKYQQTTIYDDDTIIAAQTFLATQGRTEEQINKVIKAATNLSAVTGDSLLSSVEKLDATYEGSIGRFGKLDSRLKSLTQTQLENGVAIDMLAEKYAGFAEAELETTAGKLKRLENAWGEVKETVGAALVDTILPVAEGLKRTAEGQQNWVDKIISTLVPGGQFVKLLSELKGYFGDDDGGINQGLGEFEDAQYNAAEATRKAYKEQEKQVVTLQSLMADVEKLKKELLVIPINTSKWTDKNNELSAAQDKLAKLTSKATDKIKEQKKELDKPLFSEQEVYDNKMALLQQYLGEEQRVKDEEEALAQAGADEATRIKAEEVAERLRLDDILAENEKKNQEEVTANLEAEAQRRLEIQQELSNAVMQLVNIGFNQIQNQEQKQTDYYLQNLEIRRNAGEISEQEYTKLRKSFLRQQAQDQHDLAVFQATVNGALAVINAITTGDPYTAAIRAAIAGGIAAAEIAVIASQPIPQFAKGGKVKGKSHREGGVHAELEGDEFVISKKAARKIGFDNLEMLNKGVVPVKLLRQGLSENREKRMENTLKAVFGSNEFDTYPIEKLLKKGIQNDRQVAQYLVRELKGTTRKRGGLR